ncbi:MAG: MBL fold metallo-hydrolase [Pirellulales bacterium]|nr:MBL fold metallo-hydrolase [Pirellulales bacterium]
MKPSRAVQTRHCLRALLGAVLLSSCVATVEAAMPADKPWTSGHFRMMLGPVEITALSDGVLDLNKNIFRGASEAQIDDLLARGLVAGPKMPTSVNAFLIKLGTRLVLVDAGAGRSFGPTLGRLGQNLKAAGYEPAQVDAVLVTHLHGDHMGGLIDPDGKPVFPNATVHVPKADHDLWVSGSTAKKPANKRPSPSQASQIAAPYLAAGKWKTFDHGDQPVPGIRATAAVGHTPGHTAFEVRAGRRSLLIWGDIIHGMAVQLPRPDVAVRYDANQRQAVASRQALLRKLAADQTLVAGAHMPFPGIGTIRAEKDHAYTWVPVEPRSEP